MLFTVHIGQKDYLIYHLFTAFHSPKVHASRRRSRILVTGALLLLAGNFFFKEKWTYMGIYLALAVLAGIFYPQYSRWYFKRHFEKYVKQKFSTEPQEITLKLDDEGLQIIDEKETTTITWNEVEEVNEIRSHYFFRLQSGSAFIIPKDSTNQPRELDELILELAGRFEVYHSQDLSWEWK